MSSKVTDLTPASSVGASDLLYLIQNSEDLSLSIQTLFSNIPVPVGMSNVLNFPGTIETVNAGALSLTSTVSHLSLNGNTSITLGAGSPQQIKIIVATATAGSSSATISANVYRSITFHNVGDSAMLIYTGAGWAFLGGTATLD